MRRLRQPRLIEPHTALVLGALCVPIGALLRAVLGRRLFDRVVPGAQAKA